MERIHFKMVVQEKTLAADVMSSKIAHKKSLFELLSHSLLIPHYQRPYKWSKKQVGQLLSDIKENRTINEEAFYMLGTIIVFNNEDNQLEIVDGQQRLTTLSILLYALGVRDNIGLLTQEFRHQVSKKNIRDNHLFIKNWLAKKDIDAANWRKYVLHQLVFVLVNAPSHDDAFVFFDSQNSRGKSLKRHNLLKAHHLRYIEDLEVAKICAVYWNKLDKKKRLDYITETLLGRMRKWSRHDFSTIDPLEEFKAQRITKKGTRTYSLNRYHQPPLFKAWNYEENSRKGEGLELVLRDIDVWQGSKRIRFFSDSKLYMPFQILQPLEGGEQFFWYIEKYTRCYDILYNSKNEEIPAAFRKLYRLIKELNYNTGIRYLLEVFESTMLFYYDKFGTHNIVEVAMWFEHALFSLRLRQHTLQYASVRNFIRHECNPITIINEAAFPEHIIYELKEKSEFFYMREKREAFDLSNGIRNDVKHRFYGKNGFYRKNSLPPAIATVKKPLLESAIKS